MLDVVVGLKVEEELGGLGGTFISCLPIGWATNFYVLKALLSLTKSDLLESCKSSTFWEL